MTEAMSTEAYSAAVRYVATGRSEKAWLRKYGATLDAAEAAGIWSSAKSLFN